MRNNRVKIVLALTLTVAILICNTVSVFAYEPIVSIQSDDWKTVAGLTAYRYPKGIMIGDDEKEFKKFEDLYGDTCYFSSDDSLTSISYFEISVNPADFKYKGFFIFEHSNTIYLYNFNPDDFKICRDSEQRIKIYPWNDEWDSLDSITDVETYLDIYYMKYPYNSFVKGSSFHFSYHEYSIGLGGSEQAIGEFFTYHTARGIYPVYSNVEFYTLSDDFAIGESIYPVDKYESDVFTVFIIPTNPLKVYSGSAVFPLTVEQLKLFSYGKYAFLINNMGFINGYDCDYSHAHFEMRVYDEDLSTVLDELVLFDAPLYCSIGTDFETESLSAYEGAFNDGVVFWDNGTLDYSKDICYCVIAFVFVCDTFAAFFPGDIEIVEFDSYEDDIEHDEILSSIGDASSSINNAVSDAAQDIVQGFENSLQVIVSGDTGVDRVVIDTSDVDKITVEEESILDKVYGDLDSEIDKYLPKEYDNPYDYLNDSISDFSSLNSTFAFIKEFYDRTVEATGMGAVILFVLSFGFATYAIGRRLS